MTGVEAVPALAVQPEALAAGQPGAPPGLARVQSFVNTLDVESGTDELASPAALRAWLEAHGLAGDGGAGLNDGDVTRARAVREALRELLGGNGGHPVDPSAVRLLDAVSSNVPLAVRFDDAGHPVLRSSGAGLAGALGTLMADIATAVADGTWVRLKVCRSDTCRWAYWDGSRNRSGTWCSMAVCGNRMKGRRYRRRRSQERAAGA